MQEPRVERAASAEFQFVMKDRRFFVLHQISVLALWIAVFMDECNYRNTSTLAWKGNANQIIRNLVVIFQKMKREKRQKIFFYQEMSLSQHK